MKAPDILSVILASLYLLLYTILTGIAATRHIAYMMFLLSPFVVLTMVFIVLRKGTYKGPELGERESGYADKT